MITSTVLNGVSNWNQILISYFIFDVPKRVVLKSKWYVIDYHNKDRNLKVFTTNLKCEIRYVKGLADKRSLLWTQQKFWKKKCWMAVYWVLDFSEV